MTVRIGSCFAGIGGWELGLERAIPNSRTVWQVEQNTFCQGVLKKHWPDATIFDDVRTVGAHNLQPIDLLCAGFPCQDLSVAGQKKGIYNGKKSSLYWELHRIISEIRPRIICLENVANILRLGGSAVVGSLAEIGYDCEWTVVRSGSDFGAPHRRERWFCVAYSNGSNTPIFQDERTCDRTGKKRDTIRQTAAKKREKCGGKQTFYDCRHIDISNEFTNSDMPRHQEQHEPVMLEQRCGSRSGDRKNGGLHTGFNYWKRTAHPSPFHHVDDGIPDRLARLKALGNAIVPQASEWVGRQIVQSGLIDDLLD